MKKPRKIAFETCLWFGLILVTCFLNGCQSPKQQYTFSPVPAALAATADTDSSYRFRRGEAIDLTHRFSPGEVIDIVFTPHGNLPPEPSQISKGGTITLPLIGAIVAVGKTPGELAEEIRSRYVPHYYKRLGVMIEQRVYYVGGQVQRPGRQVYVGQTTMTKAIESAGGFTEFTKGTRVELTRTDGKRFTIDCKRAAQDASLDLPVYPGDKIEVWLGYVPIFPD